jgi:hypothetical protein
VLPKGEQVVGTVPPVDFGNERAAYQELVNARILTCEAPNFMGYRTCHASGVAGTSGNDLAGPQFVAGVMAPTAILGVAETGPNSASAVVQYTFQPTPMYAQHRVILDRLWAMSANPGKTANATFQQYDDGWRLESIQ